MTLSRTFIDYPDDLRHPYAMLRAWDRHLISLGLLPIFTSEQSKVGPILVNLGGTGEHYEYRYDRRGHLVLLCTTLQEANVQKASHS